MQIRYNTKVKKIALLGLKLSAALVAFYFLWSETQGKLLDLNLTWDGTFWVVILVSLVLMVFNWSLEAEKWRISLPEENLSFKESIRIVLSGLTLNWVFPLSSGDILSRLSGIRRKKDGAIALLFNRMVMLTITAVFGGFAVCYYFQQPVLNYLVLLGVGLMAVIGVLWKYGALLGAHLRTAIRIVSLSVFRYLVFTLQYVILFKYFNPSLEWILVILGVGWVFLFRSIIPALFGHLGVREAGAVLFFTPYISMPQHVIWPCLIIWMINMVLPSIAGLKLVFDLKLKLA